MGEERKWEEKEEEEGKRKEREREREVSGNCNAAWSLYGVISTGGSGRT